MVPVVVDPFAKKLVDAQRADVRMKTHAGEVVRTQAADKIDAVSPECREFGDEFGAKNPFMTGQVAMAIDGEWRGGMIDADAPALNYGVAPFPVPDDQADQYGKGYITGTIVGIASTSTKQNAAWRFVQYLTTNTEAVVDFANAIHNVPSTVDALASPDVSQDHNFKAFLDIAANPNSNTTPASPNGGAYLVTLQDLGYDYESGKQADLQAGLQQAASQIDTDIDQSK